MKIIIIAIFSMHCFWYIIHLRNYVSVFFLISLVLRKRIKDEQERALILL